jgi:hypothetical protein
MKLTAGNESLILESNNIDLIFWTESVKPLVFERQENRELNKQVVLAGNRGRLLIREDNKNEKIHSDQRT